MRQVPFDKLPVGTVFTFNGEEWLKTEKVKVSCCKFTNASNVNDPKKKTGIKPHEIVEAQV